MKKFILVVTALCALTGTLQAATLDVCSNKTISGISVANPTTVTTSAPHNLVTGQTLTLSGTNSTPNINGSRVVTVTGASTFTVAVNVTVSGNAGTAACTYTNFQTAITAAASGDTIALQQNETFTGNFTFPNKSNVAVITVKSNADPANLPNSSTRTSPAYTAFLPKVQASAGGLPAVQFQANAQKYTLENIEFLGNPGGFGEVISIGFADASQYLATQEPTTIVLDRLYIHADPVTGQKRAVGFNANTLTLKNSYVSNIHGVGQDTQCVAGWNGTGTYTITNNYLECGTENLIFGGSDPTERIYLTVTGSSTTSGAAVQTVEAGHTLAELASGQLVSVETTAGVVEHTTLTAQPGSGTTGTLAWSPAVSVAPATGLRIRAGVVAKTVTITGNHFTKQVVWMTDGVLTTPTGLTATPSTSSGTLAAGTYWYRVQKFSTAGYNNVPVNSDVSAEVSATLNATGHIDLAWPDSAGETSYRVWCFTGSGLTAGNYSDIAANSTTFTDTGSVAWFTGTSLPGSRPQEKNLIELKAAQSVTVSGNVFEYQWRGADIGFAMWLKSVNQDGNCWWCQTRDVTIENNIFRHTDGWLLVNGREAYGGNPKPPSMTNVTIRHNLIYDSNSTWGQGDPAPYAMTIQNASTNLTIDHNTVVHLGSGMIQFGGLVHTGLVIRNNMLRKEVFGIMGDGTAEGNATLAAKAPGITFTNNAMADAASTIYPAGNFFPTAAAWQGEFVSYSADGVNADYHLKATSAYHNAATDGIDIGANIDQVIAATTGVIQGVSTSPPQITTTSLPNAIRNAVYASTTVAATGGATPYTWSVNSGSTLPTGLSFSSGGVLSGTPTATAGPYTFSLKVTDNGAQTATQSYTIQITAATTISTTTLAAAEKDVNYTATLAATGDTTPYTWTCPGCSLPAGMTLSTAGVLSGTPTAIGVSNFTVQATGGLGTSATQPLSLTVSTETLPCNRNRAYNSSEAFVFRRRTAPTSADCVVRGDVWMDTSTSNLTTYKATAVAPVTWASFTVASLSGDGSAIYNLNASELKLGTIPLSAFPNVFPSAATFSTSVTSPLLKGDYLELTQSACANRSGTGTVRLCPDASGVLNLSVNGGAYAVIGGSTGTSTTASNFYVNPFNNDNIKLSAEVDRNNDTYGAGISTVKGAKIYFDSPLGSRRQFLVFGDTNADSEVYFGLGHSSNSGASYIYDFRIRHDGFLMLHGAPWVSSTAPTISSGFGTSPTIASNNGTSSFRVNVGTGGTATTGVVAMPTATNGWNCHVYDITAQAAHTADRRTVVTASAAATVSVENQIVSTGATAGAPWAASDILVFSCQAY